LFDIVSKGMSETWNTIFIIARCFSHL
jgi:hypothetical protein